MRIENWAVVSIIDCPFTAPALRGQVFGNPRFEDGQYVFTSSIGSKSDQDEVVTMSGSVYELGQASPAYEEKFPGARDRLLGSLVETLK